MQADPGLGDAIPLGLGGLCYAGVGDRNVPSPLVSEGMSGEWGLTRRREGRRVAPFQGFDVMEWSSWGVAPGYRILPLWDWIAGK
jgi:hypothetical protein